ncbi:WXG100 family type VII secretion target [Amycolatopsis jiangsuensis]|uniref:Proteins of 100 residues with WXG n=1 Tax=Amycolatopsis jiangsuensis TaxID=1181879 RepID=A0A840IZ39_9PSEU|nr:hypothetical protein [Amycolatopsis jiangsuensis]MBB4686418.1 hypothetical protein [Amycolatopsis jiangsuensis]
MSATADDNVPSKQEVQQIIFDPRLVGNDTGRDLALRYLDYVEDEDPAEYGFTDREDFNHWRDMLKDKFHISEGDVNSADGYESDVENAYNNAKAVYDKGQEDDRKADKKAADDAKSKLDVQAGRASKTDAGAGTSDEILDLGKAGMRTFDVFVPLFNRAVAVVGTYQAANKDDLYRLYDEQRKIPFTKFSAGADEFTALAGAVTTSSTNVTGELSSTLVDWQGSAADQARSYQKNYTADAKTVSDAATHAAEAVKSACGSIGKACRDKAGWVIKYRVDSLGPVTAQDLDRIIRIAELRGNASQDDFKHCAKFLDQESQDLMDDDVCDLNDETVTHIADQCTQYCRDNFGKFFDGYIRDFKTMCTNTHTAVDGAWKALTDFLAQLPEDPFANVDSPAADSGTQSSSSGGNDSGSRSSGPGTSAGGSSTPPPAAAAPQQAAAPAAEAPTPAAATDPNVNPVTHQPLETDPATGQPYPIDPRTGEAITPDAGQPETMTVQQGDHKLSLTEPGADGRMDITVDDGSGNPKDYQLDFGDQQDTAPDQQGAAADQPTGQPAHAGQPGPDGKIHIEDGGLKITAERPQGADGPTVVTVDDGTGEPVKYTLGDDGSGADASQGSTDASNLAQGSTSHAVPDGEHRPVETSGGAENPGVSGSSGATSGAAQPAPDTPQHEMPDVPAARSEPSTVDDSGLDASGPDDSTSAQSVLNPLSDEDGMGRPASNPLGTAPSAGDDAGGGAGHTSIAGLGTAPSGADHEQQQSPSAMGMMGGGLGSAPGGGDQERASNPYRAPGGLFGSGSSGKRISGSLDDDTGGTP